MVEIRDEAEVIARPHASKGSSKINSQASTRTPTP
jgi:hypothetical protein